MTQDKHKMMTDYDNKPALKAGTAKGYQHGT
jgi:hypothetical protein